MDETHITDQKHEQPSGPGIEPDLALPYDRPVTLRLVASSEEAECNFWAGLSTPGTMTPSDILDDQRSIRDLFTDAATKGIAEDGALLVANTLKAPPQYLYFLPAPRDNFRDKAIWLADLTRTIKSIQPGSIGFYIAPELELDDDHHELVLSILRELIRVSNTSDYYLLIGDHGLNTLLNASVRLRSELMQDAINLYVFH